MAAYCTEDDLVIGDAVVPTGLTKAKFIQDAADEIDSKIGYRYDTPVAGTSPRPVLLLLKRINAFLASGRLIMAADVAGQRSELHAYGASLVKEATDSLAAIAAGTVDLPIAVNPDNQTSGQNMPLIANVDAVSQVESFYGVLTSPTIAGFPTPYRAAGG